MRSCGTPFPEPALKGGTAEAEKPGKAPRRAAREVLTAQSELDARLAKLREPTGLKVRSIETYTWGTDLGFVRIRAGDGSEGWGQLSPFDVDVAALILHRKLAPHVLGADPADFDALADRCVEANYKYPWSFVCRALAGIDTALWDWLGKRHRKGVCALLGGEPRPLPAYGSSMRRDIQPADEAPDPPKVHRGPPVPPDSSPALPGGEEGRRSRDQGDRRTAPPAAVCDLRRGWGASASGARWSAAVPA